MYTTHFHVNPSLFSLTKTTILHGRPARQKWLEVKLLIEKRQRAIDQQRIDLLTLEPGGGAESPFPTPVMKPARPHLSVLEKVEMKARLMNKFPHLPGWLWFG